LMGQHQVLKQSAVSNITFPKEQRPAADLFDPAERYLTRVAEVIDHNDIVPGFQELDARVRANISRSACYQNHHSSNARPILSKRPANQFIALIACKSNNATGPFLDRGTTSPDISQEQSHPPAARKSAADAKHPTQG